jgi:hypothetical protein
MACYGPAAKVWLNMDLTKDPKICCYAEVENKVSIKILENRLTISFRFDDDAPGIG